MGLCQPKFPSIDTQPLLGPSQGSGWGPRNCRCHKLSFAERSWNEGRCCKWQNNQIHVTDCSQIVILPNLPQKSNESPPYPSFFHNNFWDLFIFICFFLVPGCRVEFSFCTYRFCTYSRCTASVEARAACASAVSSPCELRLRISLSLLEPLRFFCLLDWFFSVFI